MIYAFLAMLALAWGPWKHIVACVHESQLHPLCVSLPRKWHKALTVVRGKAEGLKGLVSREQLTMIRDGEKDSFTACLLWFCFLSCGHTTASCHPETLASKNVHANLKGGGLSSNLL